MTKPYLLIHSHIMASMRSLLLPPRSQLTPRSASLLHPYPSSVRQTRQPHHIVNKNLQTKPNYLFYVFDRLNFFQKALDSSSKLFIWRYIGLTHVLNSENNLNINLVTCFPLKSDQNHVLSRMTNSSIVLSGHHCNSKTHNMTVPSCL